jgi:hypothetical protein
MRECSRKRPITEMIRTLSVAPGTPAASTEKPRTDAQREAAEAYIHSQAQAGWAAMPARYDDGGYRGACSNAAARTGVTDAKARRIVIDTARLVLTCCSKGVLWLNAECLIVAESMNEDINKVEYC